MKLAVIRLKGRFSLSPKVEDTLCRLRLQKTYSCTLVEEKEVGMLRACKDAISFGQLDADTLALLLAKRGKTTDGKRLSEEKKPDQIHKIAEEIISSSKGLEEHGVFPVFFLSPPKGGFGSKKAHAPRGPVGNNPEIAKLIKKMV
ncbi:MAG: hypothetical protein N3G22_00790 [Candidatus Micrarchaeota archaeon]|nr:hypothetical protein [Candidatus Micrarchaeota archaeon]